MKNEIIIQSGELMEKKIQTLKEIKIDNINWEIYYFDELTHEKWVEGFPHSEAHGGGQPQLRLIKKFPWENGH